MNQNHSSLSTRIPSARLRGSTSQITAGEVAVVPLLLLLHCEVSKPSLLSISLRSILTLVRFAVRVVQPLDAPAYMLSTVCAVSFEVMSVGAGMSTRLSLEKSCRILRSGWSFLGAISLCSQGCRSLLSPRSLWSWEQRQDKMIRRVRESGEDSQGDNASRPNTQSQLLPCLAFLPLPVT